MELAGSILGMGLIGWLIDRWQGTSPTWTLVLTGLGTVGGFYNFLKRAMALNREEAAAYKAAHPHGTRSTQTGDKPDLFERREAETAANEVPDFELPPDLHDEIERRAKAWNKGQQRDAND